MFRGSAPAKIDDKGRLKIPTDFRRTLEEDYGPELFVTSIHGDAALIYPLPVWEQIEQRLRAMPSTNQTRNRFLERVNYFGQQLRLDAQGRLVLPQILRDAAGMTGEVVVNSELDHLVIWNRDQITRRITDEPLTDDDFRVLDEHGI
jgi:transcriptional regulator MraZ